MTLTKSFLVVLKSLVESFSPSAMERIGQKEALVDPFVVINNCGRPVKEAAYWRH